MYSKNEEEDAQDKVGGSVLAWQTPPGILRQRRRSQYAESRRGWPVL